MTNRQNGTTHNVRSKTTTTTYLYKQLLTVPEAAERMTISEKSTWRMVYARTLEVVRIGRSVRVTGTSVDEVIEKGTTPPVRPEDRTGIVDRDGRRE